MTNRIDHRFAESQERVFRLLLSFEFSFLEPARHSDVSLQEQRRLPQDFKGIPMNLSLVDEFILGRAAKSGHPQGTLREVGHLFLAKEHDRRLEQLPIPAQMQAVQRIQRRRERRLQTLHIDGDTVRPLDLCNVEVRERVPFGRLIFPTMLEVRLGQQPPLALVLRSRVRSGKRPC